MCHGGEFLADFCAGTRERPQVPEVIERCLTATPEGVWVVWARKVARPWGDQFKPMTGSGSYPADAYALCRRGGRHKAPSRSCSCGFHALSDPWAPFPPGVGFVHLEVALSGRILAFEWQGGGVLFRAARQTVMRVTQPLEVWSPRPPPEEPGGRLARQVGQDPRGADSCRLSLPANRAAVISVADDAGYCMLAAARGVTSPAGSPAGRVLASV